MFHTVTATANDEGYTTLPDGTIEVNINITNHKFLPDEIHLPSGKKIRLVVHNNDSTVEEFESCDLKREKIVTPGGSTAIILAPLEPGTYKFFGDFHQDTAQGSINVQ